MIGSFNALEGWRVAGRDGDVGTLRDLYFDDERWAIRYIVVHAGGWLGGRDVLLSPAFSETTDNWDGAFHVSLTRAQIEAAPDIDTRKPVSRQQETHYSAYYDLPPYWAYGAGGALWGWGPLPTSRINPQIRADMVTREVRARENLLRDNNADAHLRSAKEVIGYHVEARDGSIGHIEDLLFDEDSWAVCYVAMTTRNWLPGKHVVIPPRHFTEVRWVERSVLASLTREAIRDGTPFDAVKLNEQTRWQPPTRPDASESSSRQNT